MTNKADLLALADGVEAATGPDRELFEDAFRLCFQKPGRIWVTDNTSDWTAEYSDWQQRQCAFYDFLEAEAYESAAMMLIPAGCEWNVEGWPTPSAVHNGKTSTAWVSGAPRVFANSPALALTAASLRATAAQGDEM